MKCTSMPYSLERSHINNGDSVLTGPLQPVTQTAQVTNWPLKKSGFKFLVKVGLQCTEMGQN